MTDNLSGEYYRIMKKEKYVTEKYLDKRLEENNQVLLAAVELVLDKKLGKLKEEIKQDIGNIQTLIDAYVKA